MDANKNIDGLRLTGSAMLRWVLTVGQRSKSR